jgi:hypothetical protein
MSLNEQIEWSIQIFSQVFFILMLLNQFFFKYFLLTLVLKLEINAKDFEFLFRISVYFLYLMK